MTTVAIAGFGFNGGQVIFKHQANDLSYSIYKEVAENCKCCCLPPPRVKISLKPGTCVTSIQPGDGFTGAQKTAYNAAVRDKTESAMSFVLDNIPCPMRSKWEYFYSFVPAGTSQQCSIYLYVPKCSDYPRDLLLACSVGDIADATNRKFPVVLPPPLHLPVTGVPFGPQPFVEYFGFRGFDDVGSSGFPTVGLCIENVCKPKNQRQFTVPCFSYEEIQNVGYLRNGVPILGYPNFLDWSFFCSDDSFGPAGKLAYFDVEFPSDQPLL